MDFALRALIAALSFGPLAVLSFDQVSFSPISQCGSFNVSFAGGSAPLALPLVLTIVPFNSSPISIPIPNSAWNETSATGAAVTRVPLPAGTTFLASLDDANGNPTSVQTSDIIPISPSNDTSCLNASSPIQSPSLYSVDSTTFTQCGSANVTYNSSAPIPPPSVRAFVPLGSSFFLRATASGSASALYSVNISRGTQVALLLNSKELGAQTSPLLTVFGDISSPVTCLGGRAESNTAQSVGSAANSNQGLSRVAIIIIAVVTVTIVGSLAILSFIFVARERRRRHTAWLREAFFPRTEPEKIPPYSPKVPPTAPSPAYLPNPRETRVITGQPYGVPSPRSTVSLPADRASTTKTYLDSSGVDTSFVLPSPPPPPLLVLPKRPAPGRHESNASVNGRPIAWLDIEQMLEQAAISPGIPSALSATPSSPADRLAPPHDRLRSPLDQLPVSLSRLPSPLERLATTPVLAASPPSSALRISPVSSKRDVLELDVPLSATLSGRFSDYSHILEPARPSPYADPPPFSAGTTRPRLTPPGSPRSF